MTRSLAWVTPYSGLSDVSAFSRNLVAELARSADALDLSVTVVVNEHGPTFWCPLPLLHLSGTAADRELLASFDLVVFNIGNNTENHAHINQLATEVPGVLVVHDLVMQHYFAFQTFDVLRRKDAYARLIGEYYGVTGLDVVGMSQVCAAQVPGIYSPWDTLHVARMPLIEPFVQSAAAVVVHSAYAEASVRPMAKLPTLRLALPWDQKGDVPDEAVASWAARTATASTCCFAAFGHISRNKSLHLMVDAFAASERLRHGARLVIAGYSGDRGYAEELRAQVAMLSLDRVVSFAYDASDADLRRIKDEADGFLNLRFPNTESASGSLVEQMATGKPVAIFPTGSYAECPDDAALRLARQDGVPALVAVMERMMDDPALRVAVGAAGRAHVRRLGAREYVAGLAAFLQEHAALLQSRKTHTVGLRRAPAPADADWLDRVGRTRRLLGGLGRPALDVTPFRDWDGTGAAALRRGRAVRAAARLACRDAAARPASPAGPRRFLSHRRPCVGAGAAEPAQYGAVRHPESRRADPGWPRLPDSSPRSTRACSRRACYLGLLRRPPQDVEVDSYTARAGREPLGRLVAEFVRSEEFRARRRRSRRAGVIRTRLRGDAAARARPPGAARRTVDGRDQPGSRVPSIPGLRLAQRRGGRGVVAGRPGHHRAFACPTRRRTAWRCAWWPASPLPRPTRPRVLRLSLDDGPVTRHESRTDAWFTLDVPLPRKTHPGAGWVLHLDSGPAVNLKEAGVANDPRELGIRLKSFQVIRRDAAAARPPEAKAAPPNEAAA